MAELFRLVNYYNLPRAMDFHHGTKIQKQQITRVQRFHHPKFSGFFIGLNRISWGYEWDNDESWIEIGDSNKCRIEAAKKLGS